MARITALVIVLILGLSRTLASAEDSKSGQAQDSAEAPKPSETKIGAVPFAGGNTDFGVGVGALGAIEHRSILYDPYQWRLETAGIITFKSGTGSQLLASPYKDIYLQLAWFIDSKLRLTLRASYTDESFLKYSGLGNASIAPITANSPSHKLDYFEWGWTHPTASAGLRIALPFSLYMQPLLFYEHNWFRIPASGRLESDAQSHGTGSIVGVKSHGLFYAEYTLSFDTRDSEVNTTWGQFHQIELRFSPGGTSVTPYRYGQTNLTLRFYYTPIRRYLTFAARGVSDFQFGDVPFYELARIEETFAFGGPNTVRGVPGQRYFGKIKLFSNLEVRSSFLPFELFGANFVLGAAVFFDSGRLWSGYSDHPNLDGKGLGLKYGIGAGPRLVVNNVLVVRADIAWSPDAHPVSGYFLAGHAF